MTLKLAASDVVPSEGPMTATCDQVPYHHPPDVTPMPEARGPTVLRVDGYDILDRLGSGGMGVVFKARHRQLNRVVALKMLGRDALADPESHRRFQAEAEAVARLQHPNIIQVFDVGTFTDGPGAGWACPFLSLEYVDGGSLFKQTLTPQDPLYSVRLLEKVARAVHAAHQVGVIHRDLKPANVLLTGEGEPKIADFGLAKQTDHRRDERGGFLTQDGTAVGTPEYMAPEQVDGLPATPAFDIYSLGVMLYELLTARQPFKGLTVTETMLLVKYQEPVPPSRLRPTLPRDLETVCLKCMAKDPARRYATAEELADDLARWLAGKPIHARPVSRAERLGRWAKRNPAFAGLAAVALALAVFGVSGVTWQWRDAVKNAELAEAKATEAELRRQAERWELYRACIAITAADLRTNTLTTTRESLDRAPEEYRGWEWDYYRGQLDVSREVYPIAGHSVHAPLVTPGGRLCVADHDGGTFVWDAVARRHVTTVRDPAYWGMTPDGRAYLRRVDDRTVEYHTLDRLTPAVTMSEDDPLLGCAFTPDGRRVLLITARTARVWDTATGRAVAAPHPLLTRTGVQSGLAALSSDGRLAAMNYTGSGETEVWEVDTGKVRFTLRDLHNLFVVRFSPDGTRLLVNEAYPSNKLKLWDVRTGTPAGVLAGHTNNIMHLSYSPDGTRIATASRDQTVRLWEADTGRRLATLRGHTSTVNSVAFSPDGTRLVSAAEDRTIRTWEVPSGQELGALRGHAGPVTAASFLGDDTLVSVGMDNTVRYWDARPGVGGGVWTGHTGFVYSAAFHPDGWHTVSGAWDGTARVWDAGGRELRRFDQPDNERVCGVAVHPSGKWVATVSWGDNVQLWDYATGLLLHTWKRPMKHWKTGRLAFHPTADLLACGGGDKAVHLFNPTTKEKVVELPTDDTDAVRDVAFSPDGKWLAAAGDSDRSVHVWRVGTWKRVVKKTVNADAVYAVAFSGDSRTLASGSLDGHVHLWETGTWESQADLPHGVKVYALAFTPDGSRLACGCADNTVRLWDLARREQVAELRGHTDYVHSVAFSPDGHRLLTASGDLTVRVWDAAPRK